MSDGATTKVQEPAYRDVGTPTGRLSYPHILTIDQKAKKYKVGLIFPLTGPLTDKLKAAFVEVAKETKHPGWPTELKLIKFGLRKGDDMNAEKVRSGKAADPTLAGMYYLTATRQESKGVVPVVDPTRAPLDPRKVVGGLNGKLSLNIAPYVSSEIITREDGTKFTRTLYGVTAYLMGIMLMGGGEPFGGSGDGMSAFDEDEEVAAAKKSVEAGVFTLGGSSDVAGAAGGAPAAEGDLF